ncbi:ABC transporter substrate-binding protein [Paenibacillus chitinolyticus]|uniref:ABC transporter substrate-binding protein n=1 Tax=Paenibacillus chitinolyticus TaxID=79263 RepID=A0A410WTJ5_9BACL|nr:ABC transporter substrate-binding protein [Paenibacillus chitinolyticus]MCY9593135.1 ABC transporter substrate-binding protein [Paenibacillus chitinolyticus]MCY9599031.1 ABC transporter substrate-binding protein [Paenibacillus chitinolyticus]QAV17719.1 ABC transporter substrate-binding protein [Paenibacillus chitinolyticus]
MQLYDYYLQLRVSQPHAREGEPVPITLDLLAGHWFCTVRNVKLLLKKMAQLDWIRWQPGCGRGRSSLLTFVIPAPDLISRTAMDLTRKGDFKAAVELIHTYGRHYALKDSFLDWMSGYFGFTAASSEGAVLDTLRLPLFRHPVSLDPAHAIYATDCQLISHVFSTLLELDPATGNLLPQLAHYWECSADGTEWTFYLRKKVYFHHGREMDAGDVKYSLERLADSATGSSWSWFIQDVVSLTPRTPYILRIGLKRPNHLLPFFLTFPAASIVPEDIVRDSPSLFGRSPIGTGPFRMEFYDKYICRLHAFDGYYGVRPHLDVIEMWILPEQLASYRPKGKDKLIVSHGDVPMPAETYKDQGFLAKEDHVFDGSTVLTFNTRRGPCRSLLLRQAIDRLIDREAMARELGYNRIGPSSGIMRDFQLKQGSRLPEVPDLNAGYARDSTSLSVDELIRTSGYDGETLRLLAYAQHGEDARWIAGKLTEAGLSVKVETMPIAAFTDGDYVHQADMCMFMPVSSSPLGFLGYLLQTTNYIHRHMSSALQSRIQNAVGQIQRESSLERQAAELLKIEDMLHAETALLFLLKKTFQVAAHSSIGGVRADRQGWVDYRHLFLRERGGEEALDEGDRTVDGSGLRVPDSADERP